MMYLRVIGYDGASYREQYGKQTPIPTITLVLNFSNIRCAEKYKTLHGILNIPDELKSFVSDYRINVIDVAFLDKEIIKCFKSDFGIVADFFVSKRENPSEYKPSEQTIKHVIEFMDFLAIFSKDKRYNLDTKTVEQLLAVNKREGIKMCDILQSYIDKGLREGETKGMAKGMAKGIEKGIEQGIEKGIEQGIEQEKLSIALKMYQNNVDFTMITLCTGLTKEELLHAINEDANEIIHF